MTLLLKRFTETFHKRCRSTFISTSGPSRSWLARAPHASPRACAARAAGAGTSTSPGEPECARSTSPTTTPTCAPSSSGPTASTARYVALSSPLGIEALPPARGRAAARRLARRRGRAAARVRAPGPRRCLDEPDAGGARRAARSRLRRRLPARPRRSRDRAALDALRARCSRCSRSATRRCSCTPAPRPRPCRAADGAPRAGVVARAHQVRGRDERRVARVRACGRPAHPRLRVCFAMLAGLAPLHRERLRRARRRRGAARPGRLPRHLVVRAARDRRGDPRAGRGRPRLRLRPAGRRNLRSRGSARPSTWPSGDRNPARRSCGSAEVPA